ncbi:MAG: hypothetical protein ACTSP4_08070 [Candidatus Hodarchaeales archaeon]
MGNKIDEILKVLKQGEEYYTKLLMEILDIKSDTVDKTELKSFLLLQKGLVNSLCLNGLVHWYLACSYILIELLSPRIGTGRFTQVQLDVESEVFFEHFKNLDHVLDRAKDIGSLEDLSNHLKEVTALINEDPPATDYTCPGDSVRDEYRLEKYFIDYLDYISDT